MGAGLYRSGGRIKPKSDAVDHPSHYTQGPPCPGCGRIIECVDVIGGWGFLLGAAAKYLWRCDLKRDAIEDLRKAVRMIQFEIERRERGA